eukprot:3097713-Amphidinium_carterae.2
MPASVLKFGFDSLNAAHCMSAGRYELGWRGWFPLLNYQWRQKGAKSRRKGTRLPNASGLPRFVDLHSSFHLDCGHNVARVPLPRAPCNMPGQAQHDQGEPRGAATDAERGGGMSHHASTASVWKYLA